MLMIQVSFKLPTRQLQQLDDALRRMPAQVGRQLQYRTVVALRQAVRDELATEPPPPKYPIRWKTAKQRIYMLNYYPGERPHRRSHHLVHSWGVWAEAGQSSRYQSVYGRKPRRARQMVSVAPEFLANGGEITVGVANYADYATFVQGHWQQPFHEYTGWPQLEERGNQLKQTVQQEVNKTWSDIIRSGVLKKRGG